MKIKTVRCLLLFAVLLLPVAASANDAELWRTDGTEEGTVRVADINPKGNSSPQWFAAAGGVAYFAATDADSDRELWRSDGTEAGTFRVADIHPSASSSPARLVRLGDEIFFTALDPVHGVELRASDGTAEGTRLVRDILDGASQTFAIGQRRTDEALGWHSTWVGVVPGGEEAFARILGVADHNPNSPVAHLDDFSSNHTGGVFFAYGDGRVQFLSENIDHNTYRALATRKGGEVHGEY